MILVVPIKGIYPSQRYGRDAVADEAKVGWEPVAASEGVQPDGLTRTN
jgi:hypothetical protein